MSDKTGPAMGWAPSPTARLASPSGGIAASRCQWQMKRSRNFRSGRKTQANECAQRFSGTARRRCQRRVLPPPPGALGVPQCAHWGGGGTADGGVSPSPVPVGATCGRPPSCAHVRQTAEQCSALRRRRTSLRRGRRPRRPAVPRPLCHCEPMRLASPARGGVTGARAGDGGVLRFPRPRRGDSRIARGLGQTSDKRAVEGASPYGANHRPP